MGDVAPIGQNHNSHSRRDHLLLVSTESGPSPPKGRPIDILKGMWRDIDAADARGRFVVLQSESFQD